MNVISYRVSVIPVFTSVLMLGTWAGLHAQAAPAVPPPALEAFAKLGPGPARESSGIVRSRNHPDLYWINNDSGDEPRIYPVRGDGTVYQSVREPEMPGVLIAGAINVDWEDIAVDSDDHVIIGDFGNNNGNNDRRDLVLYYVDEPAPTAERTTVKKKIFFRYPDQASVPAPEGQFNFDAEALFTVGTKVYILSKHRSDTRTTLYRLDDPKPHVTNVLTRLASFEIGGQPTGADASPDGKKLFVTTYDRIWLFETDDQSDRFFDGKISTYAFAERETEAVCIADDKHLLLTDEGEGVMFRMPQSALMPIASKAKR